MQSDPEVMSPTSKEKDSRRASKGNQGAKEKATKDDSFLSATDFEGEEISGEEFQTQVRRGRLMAAKSSSNQRKNDPSEARSVEEPKHARGRKNPFEALRDEDSPKPEEPKTMNGGNDYDDKHQEQEW